MYIVLHTCTHTPITNGSPTAAGDKNSIKRTASVLLFSLEGAEESVSYSTSAEQDGERGE